MTDILFVFALWAIILTAFTVKDLHAQALAKADDAS